MGSRDTILSLRGELLARGEGGRGRRGIPKEIRDPHTKYIDAWPKQPLSPILTMVIDNASGLEALHPSCLKAPTISCAGCLPWPIVSLSHYCVPRLIHSQGDT